MQLFTKVTYVLLTSTCISLQDAVQEFGTELSRNLRAKVVKRNGASKDDQDGYLLFEMVGGLSKLLAVLTEELMKKASFTYGNTLQVRSGYLVV